MLTLGDLLEEFDERLGKRAEPEILTLTEKFGFVAQRVRFNKRLAIADTSDYKHIGLNDFAFNPYLLWAGAIAQNINWDSAIISPLYPTFRVRRGFSPRFVKHLLCGGFLLSRYDAISHGSVPRKRRSSVRDFLAIEIQTPVPSLEEQERLSRLIDEADTLRRLRGECSQRMEALVPALFEKMFGDPEENRRGWAKRPVSSFVSRFEGGKNVKPAGAEEGVGRFRVLKVSAATWGTFNPAESKPVPAAYIPPTAHFVKEGDLLFSRANTTELVGATSYVFETPDRLLLPDKLWRFVWKEPREVEPLFVWWLFRTPSVRRELGRRATGSSASMKNISMPKVMSLEVPVPPFALQQEFAHLVASIRDMETQQRESKQRVDELFQSILHQAFSGEL